MSDHVHAVPAKKRKRDGQCAWISYSHGVYLDCPDDAIPGGDLCAAHLILIQTED